MIQLLSLLSSLFDKVWHEVPSQKGLFWVNLHPQSWISLTFYSIVNLNGLKSVPWWLPSHQGCFKLWPQLHQRYILSWIFGCSTVMGPGTGDTGWMA